MSFLNRIARTGALLLLLVAAGAPGARAQATQAPQAPATTAAQDEYVPIDQLPDSEKLPAAPFLIGAYVVVWGALLLYVLMLWRRLGRVEAEVRQAQRMAGGR
jgi:CcmD family protein